MSLARCQSDKHTEKAKVLPMLPVHRGGKCLTLRQKKNLTQRTTNLPCQESPSAVEARTRST